MLVHVSRNAFMHVALNANPETLLFLQINRENPPLLLFMLHAFPFQIPQETKQNISTPVDKIC